MNDRTEAQKAISRIEHAIGAVLPDAYKAFLEAGLPWDTHKCLVQYPPTTSFGGIAEVRKPHHFSSEAIPFKHGHVNTTTIEFMLDVYRKRRPGEGLIPADAIVVATCYDSEEIILFIRGPRLGQVWLKEWTRLEEDNLDDPEDGLHFIASDFSLFLSGLKPKDDNIGA